MSVKRLSVAGLLEMCPLHKDTRYMWALCVLAGNQSSYSGGQLSSGYSGGYSSQGNMGGYSDYSEYLTRDFSIFHSIFTIGHTVCVLLHTIPHQNGGPLVSNSSSTMRLVRARLPFELHGPIVCIFSFLLGNQGAMGSNYYGGGGGGSRGSMNGLGGGWGM